MLKVEEIRELIKLVDDSTIDEFVYEHEGSKIKMKKKASEIMVSAEPVKQVMQQPQIHTQPAVQPAAAEAQPVQDLEQPSAAAASEQSNLHKIVSPMVGTFYQSSSPEAGPYVNAGSKVYKETIVCIVEAMKLFNEIEAEVNGEIVEVLVKDGQLVEYGQPLFLVKPE
ncbi:acetyl-CoA carboxylase biotin carboxyl carrier protein [Cytobacillus gottheilii]|uniref:acetyl-CoA carboxylase biotin carboxyl carrier protein n=1 Tax=Cytobacillus gottheilii TaxID=859144 RepID=UPI0009B95E54|nr:acetyl-CoA carboxylase biotin carboxyl carrier protein [Cytobacillus gottheilii]